MFFCLISKTVWDYFHGSWNFGVGSVMLDGWVKKSFWRRLYPPCALCISIDALISHVVAEVLQQCTRYHSHWCHSHCGWHSRVTNGFWQRTAEIKLPSVKQHIYRFKWWNWHLLPYEEFCLCSRCINSLDKCICNLPANGESKIFDWKTRSDWNEVWVLI